MHTEIGRILHISTSLVTINKLQTDYINLFSDEPVFASKMSAYDIYVSYIDEWFTDLIIGELSKVFSWFTYFTSDQIYESFIYTLLISYQPSSGDKAYNNDIIRPPQQYTSFSM